MSKKKFTEGLESIFGEAHEEAFEGGLLGGEEQVAVKARKRSSSRKNFTSDLDSLLEGALKDNAAEPTQAGAEKSEAKQKKKSQYFRKPLSGLDALIRQTVEQSAATLHPKELKRLVFPCDAKKVEKLKKIARKEKTYLRSILEQLVSEYIQEYEKKKGELN
ncbi:MAG: hypothetical protein D6765_03290 [Bacteroidetes bacterium]|nr:MAG: hypothetical protein D6765_03290 [Bacteroidota bacterium]